MCIYYEWEWMRLRSLQWWQNKGNDKPSESETPILEQSSYPTLTIFLNDFPHPPIRLLVLPLTNHDTWLVTPH